MKVLITGAGIRVGRVIARSFADAGHQVIIHYRTSESPARILFDMLGGESAGHHCIQADLNHDAQLESLIQRLIDAGHPPDCLINCAGTFPRERLIDHSLASIESTFRINCFAPFVLMRDFARHIGHGNIVNILDQRVASINPDVGAYAIAKMALRDFTLACALDWAPTIRVNAVAPGLTLAPEDMSMESRRLQIDQVPMKQESSPAEIARTCLFLAEAETITGAIIPVDGGLHMTRLG